MKERGFSRIDAILATSVSLLALVLGVWMAWSITERIPHVEDEIAYLFQARIFARGALWAPLPPDEAAFFTPFMVIVNGHWISKYPIGWPLLLAVGEVFGAGWLVNQVLVGLTAGLVYAIGTQISDRQIGLLAGVLFATSPLVLIQAGTYMSHASAGFWVALLTYAWLRLNDTGNHKLGWSIVVGLALGMLGITRPLSGFGVFVPFMLIVVFQLAQSTGRIDNVRKYLPAVGVALLVLLLQPTYLALSTGNPFTNLYTIVWPYDRIGFGEGIGVMGRHTLVEAFRNAHDDLRIWASDFLGWRWLSWLPLIPGLGVVLRQADEDHVEKLLILAGPFVFLVIVHLAYWTSAQVYSARYYYEGTPGLIILAALGICNVVRWASQRVKMRHVVQCWAGYILSTVLIALNVIVYLPARAADWQGLYGITRQPLEELEARQFRNKTLVLVQGRHWDDFGALWSVNSPWLDEAIIVGHYRAPERIPLILPKFPDREVLYFDGETFSEELR